jgi:hypothetical protein
MIREPANSTTHIELERCRINNTLSRLGYSFNITAAPETSLLTDSTQGNTVTELEPITTNCIQDENGITEVVLDVETLNGIPVESMITLIRFETMVASLYAAIKVHNRKTSMYGSLPIETIFNPVISGCMSKGICHALDIHACLRILNNCLSRALFVNHKCVPFIYTQLLKCFSDCSPYYVKTIISECCRKAAKERIERFLRIMNDEMYNWKGYVIKPMPTRAPYSLYDMDIGAATHYKKQETNTPPKFNICNILKFVQCCSDRNNTTIPRNDTIQKLRTNDTIVY